MPTRSCLFTLAAGLVLMTGAVAQAAVPNPPHCTVMTVVVASSSGITFPTADPFDQVGFQVTVRDINNAPIFGSTVTLDYSAAAGTRIYSGSPGGTVNCALHSVSRTTDSSGYVKFGVQAGGFNNANVVTVSADGVILANVRARSTDIDALGGRTDVNDLNLFRLKLFAGAPPEIDYDISGVSDVGDLNLFRQDLFSGAVGAYCP
jgi:hypothetical protein